MAVRMSTELLMSEDALLATAVNELRWRAGLRGATHLVVARPASVASVAYGTTAAATGVAYRCPICADGVAVEPAATDVNILSLASDWRFSSSAASALGRPRARGTSHT